MAQGGGQVVQPQFLHQHTDAALGKASLVAAAIRVFVKFHVPRVGVAVGGFQSGSGLHSGNILWGELAFSAFAAEPLHGLCHHGSRVVIRHPVHLRTLRHGEDERAEHCAVDDVHFEAVGLFKLRQTSNDLPVLQLCLFRDDSCSGCIITQHSGQLLLKGTGKQHPHSHGHSGIFHCLSPNPIFTICIFIPLSPTFARKRKKPLTEGSFKSL